MPSLINAVRHLVVDGLSNTVAFQTPDPETGVQPEVRFGWKANWTAREKVFTTNMRFTHESASLRAVKTYRNEDAGFDLTILVAGLGQTEETVADRALVLGGAVEDWVATHANWSGKVPGLKWLVVSGEGTLTPAYGDKGVLVELVYPIRYNARLT